MFEWNNSNLQWRLLAEDVADSLLPLKDKKTINRFDMFVEYSTEDRPDDDLFLNQVIAQALIVIEGVPEALNKRNYILNKVLRAGRDQ